MTLTKGQRYLAALGLVLVAGGVGITYYVQHRGITRDSTGNDVIAVTTQPAKTTTLREALPVSGTVTPQIAADFLVSASQSCTIAELPKNEGDTVQPGDVIVRLDLPAVASEVAMRQLEVTEAMTKADSARAEAARLGSLYDRGLVAKNQADAARAALSVAEANLGQAKGRLEAAKVGETATVIRARFAGVVVKRWHSVGDTVSGLETDPILRVVDLSRLQISAKMPAADATRILPGQNAEVQTETGPVNAIVAVKLNGTGADAAMTDVRLNFETPTSLPLDTPLQMTIVVNERPNVLVVPVDAVQRADTQTFVWIADTNNQATKREVRLGYITNGQAEVVSGLTAGEQVIVTGIAELTEGTRISIGR